MGKTLKQQIVYMKPDELIPYENNPRINDQAVDAVANSIEELDFRNPIIVDKNNVVIAGHTRLKAAKQLGLEEVPVIKANDMTPEQARAYRLIDNKTNELADWDKVALNEELKELQDYLDMEDFGFDSLIEEAEELEIKTRELKPFVKVHYLISADLDYNDKILDALEKLKNVEGVEIVSSTN